MNGEAIGGIILELPFLLANAGGEPKTVTDGNTKHLVIFDGEFNNWLRDPVYLFRRNEPKPEPKPDPEPEPSPEPEPESVEPGDDPSGGGGCDTGFGAAMMMVLLPSLLIAPRFGKQRDK
ncbi:MAG: hypothetical protein LBS00_12565 [Synergistaceae bacterium]|jgi:hypothetical protein|nr:hypothetical protein [Synergistaceae bacterium]